MVRGALDLETTDRGVLPHRLPEQDAVEAAACYRPADELTGLTNRRTFRDCLAAALLSGSPAVVMVDLDRFKPVNDSLGHPVGDALLRVVAQRLRSAVREEDVVARLGGDEFAVLLCMGATAERLAERIIDLLARPYLIEGHLVTISASAGLAVGPRDGADAATLIRNADLALLDRDLLACPVEEISEIRLVGTWVGGERVHG